MGLILGHLVVYHVVGMEKGFEGMMVPFDYWKSYIFHLSKRARTPNID